MRIITSNYVQKNKTKLRYCGKKVLNKLEYRELLYNISGYKNWMHHNVEILNVFYLKSSGKNTATNILNRNLAFLIR